MADMAERVGRILERNAELFAERNGVYKDNYVIVGEVMRALFPDGVQISLSEDFERWHLFELFIVKLTRYAVQYKEGGHDDSLNDMINYLAMLQVLDQEGREGDGAEREVSS